MVSQTYQKEGEEVNNSLYTAVNLLSDQRADI